MTFVADNRNLARDIGGLGTYSLDHLALTVSDLREANRFYSSFELEVREERAGLGLSTRNHPLRWGRLFEGRTKKLQYLTFGIFAEDLEPFKRRQSILQPPTEWDSAGL